MKPIYLLLLLIFFYKPIQAQIPQFSDIQAKEDLRELQYALESYNPGLFSLMTEATWKALNDSLGNSVQTDSIDGFEFYRKVAYLTARCRERHIKIGVEAKQPKHWLFSKHQDSSAMFPFILWVRGDSAWIIANLSEDTSIQRGTCILSINGNPMHEELAAIRPYIGMDGINPQGRDHDMSRFWVYYYHWFRPQNDYYTIQTIDTLNQMATYRTQAVPLDSLAVRLARRPISRSSDKLYEFTWHDSLSLAVVRYDAFSAERHRKELKKSPKKLFKEMVEEAQAKEAQHLAIDLRSNPGGRTRYMEILLRHLVDTLDGKLVYRKGTNRKGKTVDVKLKKPLNPLFTGKVYLLVNGGSFSASTITAGILKHTHRATIIGTETGGRAKAFTAGSHKFITLSHTGIKVGIPLYYYEFPIVDEGDGGVIPHVRIHYNIHNIVRANDLTMKKLFELVRK